MSRERIVAVGSLSQTDLDRLGQQFSRAWPVQNTPCYGALLEAIDQADRELRREEDNLRVGPATT